MDKEKIEWMKFEKESEWKLEEKKKENGRN